MVEFSQDGQVVVQAAREACTGQTWFFQPGPAHLDTCEFTIASNSEPDLILKYVGFIDRGQRVESR
jgi:hypothetical protein